MHANPAARALSGELALPASSQDWVRAARLVEVGGRPYAPGASPLDQAAAGQPVFGEPVQVPVVPTAHRDADAPQRRTLWVTGFPLPQDDTAQALVVLFDVETSLPEARIRDRAVVAAGLSFTISDPQQPDHPLVFVNPAFERTTGYSDDEDGRAQLPLPAGAGHRPRRPCSGSATRCVAQEHAVVTLLNYRKDGTAFWNELSISPVYDATGVLTHFVGIQADVTARVPSSTSASGTSRPRRAARAAGRAGAAPAGAARRGHLDARRHARRRRVARRG